ncbi:MAG: Mut7-C RNAse domain-containing protein [Thermoproteota archaeon]|nr:Mut7-C RNAse domain-containing protein [Thermoproteota archaeon]
MKSVGPKYRVRDILPSFLADAMLGDIARKLRILGYDTTYIKDTEDNYVLQEASKEERIVLTRDRELFRRVIKNRIQGILLDEEDEIDNIAYALTKNKIYHVSFSTRTARCSLCNGILKEMPSADARSQLPTNIARSHTRFFQCSKCIKFYWEGSHVSGLHMLARRVNDKIKKLQ